MTAEARSERVVLVVDDDPDVVEMVRQLLAEHARVEATTEWGKVNNWVFRAGCDLVLMDVNLPVLKGDQLVSILTRLGGEGERPRIVYFSSLDEATLARLAKETGADGWLSKSMRSAELRQRIEGFLVRP